MRDKNLTQPQFDIQLENLVTRITSEWFLTRAVLDIPNFQNPDEVAILYPRDFVGLRSLSIACWYLPDKLKWRIFLDLREMSFSWLNWKQRIEILLNLERASVMRQYLYWTDRYTSRELFGNILGQQLKETLSRLRIKVRKLPKPRKRQRKRGYQDHGSRRPPHKWLPKFDSELTEIHLEQDRKLALQSKVIQTIVTSLEELSFGSVSVR